MMPIIINFVIFLFNINHKSCRHRTRKNRIKLEHTILCLLCWEWWWWWWSSLFFDTGFIQPNIRMEWFKKEGKMFTCSIWFFWKKMYVKWIEKWPQEYRKQIDRQTFDRQSKLSLLQSSLEGKLEKSKIRIAITGWKLFT